jgi:hypothetical protein
MPSPRATARAPRSSSPVIMATPSPIVSSASTASLDSSLTVSATATMPAGSPSTATSTGVLPSPESLSNSGASPSSGTP